MKHRIALVCHHCGSTFLRSLKNLTEGAPRVFCGRKCFNSYQEDPDTEITVPCGQCGSSVTRSRRTQKESKSGHLFCGHPCAAKYANTHKTTGTRRSKLEVWLEGELRALYPNLDLHCNRNSAIGQELDFYYPSLKTAFEVNGILHYQPIYGAEKLRRIQEKDRQKMLSCEVSSINLHVINDDLPYHTPEKSRKILHAIRRKLDAAIAYHLEKGVAIDSVDPIRGQLVCTLCPKPRKRKSRKPRPEKIGREKRPKAKNLPLPHYRVTDALIRACQWNARLEGGEKWRDLARSEGVSQMMISNYLRLLHLPDEIQERIRTRHPSVGFMTLASLKTSKTENNGSEEIRTPGS